MCIWGGGVEQTLWRSVKRSPGVQGYRDVIKYNHRLSWLRIKEIRENQVRFYTRRDIFRGGFSGTFCRDCKVVRDCYSSLTCRLCSVENVQELFQLAELFRDDTSCTTRNRATWSLFVLLPDLVDICRKRNNHQMYYNDNSRTILVNVFLSF